MDPHGESDAEIILKVESEDVCIRGSVQTRLLADHGRNSRSGCADEGWLVYYRTPVEPWVKCLRHLAPIRLFGLPFW